MAILAASSAARAAEAQVEADSSSNQLEEVVVTAQFREQNLQDTPIAITAVTARCWNCAARPASTGGGAGAQRHARPDGRRPTAPALVAFIRGVGQTDFNYALEPGVGIYVDDVYYSTLTGSIVDLMDIERVEVLRGPQGTLAGRNSIGGAIKMFSQNPEGGDGGRCR